MAHLHGIRIGNYDMPPSKVALQGRRTLYSLQIPGHMICVYSNQLEIICMLGKQFEKEKKKKKKKPKNSEYHLASKKRTKNRSRSKKLRGIKAEQQNETQRVKHRTTAKQSPPMLL
ncbi:hypothetical protein ACN38_g8263 [Penicillium nordicum]|uniref:Uncharacterized protein n=1 Tax=Penicillium nordicum TaxID=229535 RepID=A0A0M9WDL7_9EURO|nr:hypothetical protein ACN38_g8263 [Penicillium nordicum]